MREGGMAISRRDFLGLLASASISQGLAGPVSAGSARRFVFANNSPYDSLDPHTVYDAGRAGPRLNLYDGLYRYVDNPPKLIPWLAESHGVSDDRKSYIFRLRPGVVFHDGTPVTAQDVVYSIDRILALNQGPASLYRDVVKPGSTEARDPLTVVFNLAGPSAIFMATIPDIAVLNSSLMKRHTNENDWAAPWLAKNEAGSGSFELTSFDPARGWTAKRSIEHFGGFGTNPIDELEFRNVMETNTRVLGLMRGDFQGSDGYMPYDQIQRLRKSQNIQVIEQEAMRVFLLMLNNAAPPLDDVHFRRALAYSFDYDGFINGVMNGSVSRNPSPLPNTMWGTPRDVKVFNYDLDKASEELKQVKSPIRSLNIRALAGFSESEQAAILFQSALKKIGVESKVTMAPWPVIAKSLDSLDTRPDIVPIWRSAFYLDPNSWVGEGYGSRYEGQKSLAYYRNPQFDKLLDQALLSSDHGERQVLYESMTRMVTDDAASIFVYNSRWYGPYSAKASGVRYSPVNYGQDFRWVSMEA
ncbi:ABC transporter substrate-binding protein (plasmid) [Rhizobium leguminosarum]|nr:ABC transporter substrate-binding protein [Rhizobium leguminosarum]NEI02024.1 ABC transporter substrate-binding protein [Rhizobium leguminosarum]NEI54825.1 ABC transporter substrate-binding protein [Rhizobium leguminosarum]NEI84097.1 ABC transporter substrate-binding protein [Rhizobium leguminosarum]NEJ42921.1 ABC transporter substrate-binding protein [Rhizobium leguminosarum]